MAKLLLEFDQDAMEVTFRGAVGAIVLTATSSPAGSVARSIAKKAAALDQGDIDAVVSFARASLVAYGCEEDAVETVLEEVPLQHVSKALEAIIEHFNTVSEAKKKE